MAGLRVNQNQPTGMVSLNGSTVQKCNALAASKMQHVAYFLRLFRWPPVSVLPSPTKRMVANKMRLRITSEHLRDPPHRSQPPPCHRPDLVPLTRP